MVDLDSYAADADKHCRRRTTTQAGVLMSALLLYRAGRRTNNNITIAARGRRLSGSMVLTWRWSRSAICMAGE